MPDLKLHTGSDKREQTDAGSGRDGRAVAGPGSGPQRALTLARAAAALVAPRTLWRSHRLFTILALLSLLPRILAALAFRPALLTADSFVYMNEAAHFTLGTIRPSGYSFFLRVVEPFHSLLLVTTAQHLMGVAVAAIVYGLLRYHGLPGWGAVLAAAPTLFDTRQIALESYLLPDTLYCLVIMLAVAVLLTKRTPRPWQCVAAGLLLAYASVLRGNGLPIVFVALAFMLLRRVGWRAVTAAGVAAAIPLIGYAAAFDAANGQFNITASDGLFLWSRTTSFANCAIIKPPPQLLPLCPGRDTAVRVPPAQAWSVPQLLGAPTPADYLWASTAWWKHDAHPGINNYNDDLGTQFALDAIKAQPLGYLRVVARDVALVFVATDRPQAHATMTFTAKPHIAVLPAKYVSDLSAYAHTGQNTHLVQPYAYFLFLYQQPVYFPGVIFLLVVMAGLAGIIRSRRQRGGLAALPWAVAAASIAAPALLTQSLYRYTIVAIPLACVAAGLAFVRRDPAPVRQPDPPAIARSSASAPPAMAAAARATQVTDSACAESSRKAPAPAGRAAGRPDSGTACRTPPPRPPAPAG